nr:unnamed protein product [Digitaria exilis]
MVATTAPPDGRCGGCLACLRDVVQALSMGSCLTTEQQPAVAVPSGKEREARTREEEVPGRIARNGVSNVACLFPRQGRKGTNQDAMVVWEISLSSITESLGNIPYH